MNKRKMGKGQLVAIIVLILLLIANCSYIAYDKLYIEKGNYSSHEKKKKQKEQKESKKITRKLSIAEQKILLDQIDSYNSYLSLSYPIEDITTFDNQKKLLFAYNNMDSKSQKEFMQGDLKKIAESYFGKNSNITYESIKCPYDEEELYRYDDATRVYTIAGTHGHGGAGRFQTYSYYLDGTVTDETKYVVEVHILYGKYCTETCGSSLEFYSNAMDAKENQNSILSIEEEEKLTDTDYNKIKEKLATTTFTFEKDTSGNFGLKSVQVLEL